MSLIQPLSLMSSSSSSLSNSIIHHKYTYLFTDLRTNQILGELPLQNVSYSTKLSAAGEAKGNIQVNVDTTKLRIKSITEPGKTGLYILRDGVPRWGGIVWKRQYSGRSRQLSLSGKTFESYFYHRLQRENRYFVDTDQLDIARWLVESGGAAQALGIDVSDATSPRLRERRMNRFEFKTVGQELEALSGLIDGFDWNVEISRDTSGAINRRLEFYYPQAGVARDVTQLFFEYPGSIADFTLNEDAENSGTSIWAIGAGEGSEQVEANAQDASQVAAGWPLLELTRSYKSVISPITLQSHADADRDRLRTPITVFEVKVDADEYPELGQYRLGDWARFKMEDAFLTPALDSYARITGIEVSVDGATGLEEVSLTLGGDEATSDSSETEDA